MKDFLTQLISQVLGMKLFYHNSHLIVKNPSFFSDHSAFGDFYGELEGDFDSLSERLIGIAGPEAFSLAPIVAAAAQKLPQQPAADNAALFTQGLAQEQELQRLGGAACKSPECSEGTRQLIGDILNISEKRIYKIKQRLRK